MKFTMQFMKLDCIKEKFSIGDMKFTMQFMKLDCIKEKF